MKVLLNVEKVDNVVLGYELYNEGNVFRKRDGIVADVDLNEYSYHKEKGDAVLYEDGKLVYSAQKDKMIHRIEQVKQKFLAAKQLATYEECLKDCILSGRPLTEVKAELDKRTAVTAELEAVYEAQKAEYESVKAVKEKAYLSALCNAVTTDKVALVAIMKDEDDYLSEWLDHHLSLGFDRIFIYDNDSKNPITASDLRVTVLNQEARTDCSTQQYAYNRWLDAYGKDYAWVMFLDADEFVDLGGKTVGAFLAPFKGQTDVGFVNLRWQHYGAGGQTEKTSGSVRERFAKRGDYECPNDFGKGFLRTCAAVTYNIHNARLLDNAVSVNADGSPAEFAATGDARKERGQADALGHIKHYYTKSLAEWERKIKRGSVDALYQREYGEFVKHNRDMAGIVPDLKLRQKYQEEQ